MALPKATLPIFSLTVPSTGQRIQFHQFTIREEKSLMQAQESDDLSIITNAVKEVIRSCVTGLDDVESLALFDVEYIITKIRAKSVGEYIDLNLPCDKDAIHRRTPVRINLEKIEVTIPTNHSRTILLYDDVGVTMRYPTLADLAKLETMTGLDAAVLCIENIFTDEEVFDHKDQTTEELLEFVSGLTPQQYEMIEEKFFKSMPVFQHEFEYDCVECGHHHKKMVKGLANFFV